MSSVNCEGLSDACFSIRVFVFFLLTFLYIWRLLILFLSWCCQIFFSACHLLFSFVYDSFEVQKFEMLSWNLKLSSFTVFPIALCLENSSLFSNRLNIYEYSLLDFYSLSVSFFLYLILKISLGLILLVSVIWWSNNFSHIPVIPNI